MKAKLKSIVLGALCFLAGFLACLSLIPQSPPAPIPAPAFSLFPFQIETFSNVHVSTQIIQLGGGTWYHHADGVMRRSPPPEMQMQPRSLHLIYTKPAQDAAK
jgi:hypothetical protein